MPRLAMLAALAATTAATQQPSPAPGPRLAEPDLVAALEAHLDSLAASNRFSGVVALVRGDTRVFERAFGLADREGGVRNALDTRFNLGSINKAFTAIAIRQLAKAGKLALTDKLIQHLPDYPNRDVAERVTIAQLLEHTSGIGGNIFAAPPGGSRNDLRTTARFLALVAHEPLQFEPGRRQQYSNAGYVVLGAVIERLSGMSYYDLAIPAEAPVPRRGVRCVGTRKRFRAGAAPRGAATPPPTTCCASRGSCARAGLRGGRPGGWALAAARPASTRSWKRESRATTWWCWPISIRRQPRTSAGRSGRGWASQMKADRALSGGRRSRNQAPTTRAK
ncbi:MAG: beta-lactamase family protein [Gemmatimonadetes bacterium]|nr:beta-lactamase family protein [Gemmatimonadota bacterium]